MSYIMNIFKKKLSKGNITDQWKNYSYVDKTGKEKLTDLYAACQDGELDVMKLLIEKAKVGIEEMSEGQEHSQRLTLVHVATRHNRPEVLKYLISRGADVNVTDIFGFRPIHDAALYGYHHCLKILLENNSLTTGVDDKSMTYLTPMFYAVQQGHSECVNLLKEQSPDISKLVWDVASKRGNTNMAQLDIKEQLSDLTLQEWLRNSALCGHVEYFHRVKEMLARKFGSKERLHSIITATQHGRLEYLENLLNEGMDPNTITNDKATPLHYAARYGYTECIDLLVKRGADVERRTVTNWTPLHVALLQCCTEGVEALIRNGCDINAVGGELNDSPVHIALKTPVDDITMKALLKNSPLLTIRNKTGKLPTEIVSENEHLNDLLLEYARN